MHNDQQNSQMEVNDDRAAFEVISLGPPADGWRAIFSSDSGIGIMPLVCWAAFRKKTPASPMRP